MGGRSRNNQPLKPTMSLAAMTATDKSSKSIFKTFEKVQTTDKKDSDKNPYANVNPFKTIEISTKNLLRGQSAASG